MTASIIPFTNHRGSSSHAVTAAGEGVTPPALSPAPSHPRCYSVADGEPGLLIAMRDGRAKPFSPLECDGERGRKCSVDGCDGKHYGRGFCEPHYYRWRQHGDPLGRGRDRKQSIRFLRGTLFNYEGDECVRWPFDRNQAGYARIQINGVQHRVTRLLCEERFGEAPTSKHEAAHSCGNAWCVNINHLRWATRKENERDKRSHGTYGARLTPAVVREIRKMNGLLPRREIAQKFNLSRSHVAQILTNKAWAWVK